MTRRFIASVVFLSMLSLNGKAQDPEFSQFFNAPLYLNPAFAGVGFGPRICASYRNEWPALGNAYVTYAASFDQYVPVMHSGFGLLGSADEQANGLYSTTGITGMYAYQIDASENVALRMAMQVSFLQRSIRSDQLIFADNIDPSDGLVSGSSSDLPDLNSKSFVDFGGGLLLFSEHVFAGISAKHLTQPNESLSSSGSSPLPIRVEGNFGVEAHSRNMRSRMPVYFSPNVMYVQQAQFKQATAGAILGVGVVYGGVFFRHAFENADAFIPMVGMRIGIFKMGYSYDVTLSGLQSKSGGSHEVSVVLNFHDSKAVASRAQRSRFTKCPLIF